jgi:hypothetical protein
MRAPARERGGFVFGGIERRHVPPVPAAWLACVLVARLAAAGPAPIDEARYPRDLAPGHWAHHAARDLAERGILKGFPDGTFKGHAPVNRFTLARALAQTLGEIDALAPPETGGADDAHGPGGAGPAVRPGGPGALAPDDARTLARLARELSRELSRLSLRTAGLEQQVDGHRLEMESLKARTDRLSGRVRDQDRFHYTSGELRVVGFNNEEIRSFTNLILNFDYRISDRISGVFSPELANLFDGSLADRLGVWEAYADFADFGVVDNLRAGRQLMTIGAGLTLLDRVEGFNFTSTYSDLFFQILFLGDLMLLVEGQTFAGQAYGFYYIEEGRNPQGKKPLHLGAYVKGNLGPRLYVGLEYANYSNRAVTTANHDIYTQAWLADVRWDPSPDLRLRQSFMAAEEDFRAFAIDRDLSYHSPVSSPLEDVLQAISFASRLSPVPTDKNEINGFWDLKSGVVVRLPRTRFWLGLDWDHVRDFSSFFNNRNNEFNVYALRLRRPVSEGSWMEFRARDLTFDRPDPSARAGTLDIPRIDRSDFRVQFFGRF